MVPPDAVGARHEAVAADFAMAAGKARLCGPGLPFRLEELGYGGLVVGRRVFRITTGCEVHDCALDHAWPPSLQNVADEQGPVRRAIPRANDVS